MKKQSVLTEMVFEVGQGLRDIGKDVVRGVTRLPHDLIFGTWSQEWLSPKNPDAPRISKKTGLATQFDPQQLMDQHETKRKEASLQSIRQRLTTHFTSSMKETPPVMQKEEKKVVTSKPILETGSIRKRGDWMHRRRKSPSPTDLNRTEYSGNKGAQ